MAIPFAAQVTVRRAPLVVDRYNGSRRDWGAAVEHEVMASVQPDRADEAHSADRDQFTSRLLMVAEPDSDVLGTDRVVWRGLVYEVDGDPQYWPEPIPHVELHLRLVAG